MSNKTNFLKKLVAGAIGFFEGLIIGPFAFAGKWLSMWREEEIGHDLRMNRRPHGCAPIILTLVFFAGGLIYGPIRGAQLGFQNGIDNGCKDLVRNISNELFTYDPFYWDIITPQVASQYPGEHLISYRKFHDAGLLNRAADQTHAPLLSSVSPLGNIRHDNKDNLKTIKAASLDYSPALRI